MSFRSVLAVVGGRSTDRPVLETALATARLFDSWIEVLHPRIDPLSAMPFVGDAMSGAIAAELMQSLESESESRAREARSTYELWRVDHGLLDPPSAGRVSSAWLERVGRPGDIVAHRGRLAVLIVVGRPAEAVDGTGAVATEVAIFESGRPVLCVPPTMRGLLESNVAVLWNGSPQAARAVGDAMAFLLRGGTTTVVSLEDGGRWEPSAVELVERLGRQGVKTSSRILAPGHASTAESLAGAIAEIGANLVVMGAYSHSRLRELVLGGVTRHMLSHAAVPVLMAH